MNFFWRKKTDGEQHGKHPLNTYERKGKNINENSLVILVFYGFCLVLC